MEQCFFAVDLGATSGRTILGSFTSEGLKMEEINRFPNHLIEVTGHYYWDIYELYRNIIEGLKLASRKEGMEIVSIGIDTWGVDFVCVGKDGHFLRPPYSYRDPHTENAPAKYFERMPRKRVYELTGIQVMNFNSLFQLDTMRRHKDSALEAANKILFIPDALSYMLTGEMACEYTIASTAQLVNASTRRLEPELLKSLNLSEENFGRFVYPGETVGTLTEEVQRITGLGAVPVIAVAGHDTASAVAAVPAQNKNFAYLSSGTWSLMGIKSDKAILTSEELSNEGGVNNTFRYQKNIMGMWVINKLKETLKTPMTFAEMDAGSLESGYDVTFDVNAQEFFAPENMRETILAHIKAHDLPMPASEKDIVRAVYRSLAKCYKETYELLERNTGKTYADLYIVGGGAKNKPLNGFTREFTGKNVVALPIESTALGNLKIQMGER